MRVENIQFQRDRFQKALNYYGKKGIAPEISFLRIDQPLSSGQGSYEFNLKKENLVAGENGLKRNDLFIVTQIGIFLAVKDTTKPGIETLMTYAQKEDSTNNVPGFTTLDINALYNGKLYVSTGSTVNIEDMPTSLFKRVPQTQYGQTTQPEFNMNDDAQFMAEELILAGTQDHIIRVTFPTFATANYGTTVANGQTNVVFYAIGYRIPGGTSEIYKNDPANPYAAAI